MSKRKAIPTVPLEEESSLAKVGDEVQERINSLYDLLERTDVANPSEKDRMEFERQLEESPDLWPMFGDMMALAAGRLIRDIKGSHLRQASLKKAWNELPNQLAQPGDGRLEQLLVQQAVLCWLQLGYVEYRYSAQLTNGNTQIKQAEFWERRLDAAQRRYLKAFETMVRVRRLNLPTVQVNIARQQVNQINQGG